MTTQGARPQFRQTRGFAKGYATEEVDAFVDEVFNALAGDQPAPNIVSARFGVARGRRGYDMEEVDLFLDELNAGLGGAVSDPTEEEAAQDKWLQDRLDEFGPGK